MRPSRLLALPFLLLALAACKKAPPPERFIADDTQVVLLFPSLDAFAKQTSDALDTIATFPGGQAARDAAAVAKSRLGFDLLDPKSMADAGLDPKRGAATGLNLGMDAGPRSVLVVLPVSDAKKFAATLDSLAKDKLGFPARGVDAGSPEVVTFTHTEGAPAFLAYAIIEKSAVISMGPECVEQVRKAIAVPKDKSIGGAAGYKAALEAIGPGQGFVYYVGPIPQMQQLMPSFKQGMAVGISAAKDRLALAMGMPLDPGSPYLKVGKADAGALVAKLDPGAAWVMRSDSDIASTAAEQKKVVMDFAEKASVPDQAKQAIGDAIDSLGGGAAFGLGIVQAPAGTTFEQAPLSFFRGELIFGLKDPAKMKGVLAMLSKETEGKLAAASPDGPWTFTGQGGEAGVAVEDGRLLVAVGPAGALKALAGRSGTTFKAPTATSAKAFGGSMGGMFIDVPKLAEGVKAIPASAYGEGPSGEMKHSAIQENLPIVSRITAISATGEVKGNTLRSEVVIEVAPAPAK
jgi:hypothetical protein